MVSNTVEVNQESNKRMSFTSVKSIGESPELTSIPSSYIFTTKPDHETVANPKPDHETVANPDDDDDVDIDDPIPIIDYSLLVTGTPDQRAKVIHDLGKACVHWGFFMLINHSVPKSQMEKMVDQLFAFFNLKEEEKQGIQVLSNGKYKSVLHRVVVSNKPTRMSLVTVIAPSLDTVGEPAPELIDNHTNPPAYFGMKHKDFMELQRSNQFYGKSVLNKVKI